MLLKRIRKEKIYLMTVNTVAKEGFEGHRILEIDTCGRIKNIEYI